MVLRGSNLHDLFFSPTLVHALFYIPLSFTIHDCNTMDPNQILFHIHPVFAGITEKTILNGHEVKLVLKTL